MDVLKNASNWQAPQFIDILGKSKESFDNALIIIDPVDSKRNAAANISTENFVKFVNASGAFLKKPEMKYFFPEKTSLSPAEIKNLQKRGSIFISLEFKKPDLIDDILYPQVRRSLKRLENLLNHNEFFVVRSMEFIDEKIYMIFELEIAKLPPIKKMMGPPVTSKKHSNEFLSKYGPLQFKPYVQGNIWVAEKFRDFVSAQGLLEDFISKNEKTLQEMGIPDNIAKVIRKARFADFWKLAKNKEFSSFLKQKYFPSI